MNDVPHNAPGQHWQASGYAHHADFVPALGDEVAALLARGISGKARFPWFYPTVEEYSTSLKAAGFTIDSIELIPRPTPLPTGMAGWLATFANPFLHGLEEEVRETILDNAVDLLSHSLSDSHGNWTADYVRLRLKAHR
ncbi:hypothetical protein [Halomonas alkalisoli]|uniref:hypothetical protein n=1 Tax=Halomonas alkalisoli TaxID=2907158 RepID=UPI0034E2BDA1